MARVASGQVQTLVKNENAAEVKTTKEAKISVAVFLVAMVGIVLLGSSECISSNTFRWKQITAYHSN